MLSAVLESAKGVEPLTLAVLFIGLMGLGAIWLASMVIRHWGKK